MASAERTRQEIMKLAFENGINYFDTAEGYADGNSEVEMYYGFFLL